MRILASRRRTRRCCVVNVTSQSSRNPPNNPESTSDGFLHPDNPVATIHSRSDPPASCRRQSSRKPNVLSDACLPRHQTDTVIESRRRTRPRSRTDEHQFFRPIVTRRSSSRPRCVIGRPAITQEYIQLIPLVQRVADRLASELLGNTRPLSFFFLKAKS